MPNNIFTLEIPDPPRPEKKYTSEEIKIIMRWLFNGEAAEYIADLISEEKGYYDETKAFKLLNKMKKVIKANIKEIL